MKYDLEKEIKAIVKKYSVIGLDEKLFKLELERLCLIAVSVEIDKVFSTKKN